jgi:N-dimethylarginine dimethylaminohydrolase
MNREHFPHGEILMCLPKHYGIEYEINVHMDTEVKANHKRATAQWINLLNTIVRHGAYVTLMDEQEKLPDMVFTANAGLAMDDIFIPSRFLHSQRQGEEEYFTEWFERRGYDIRHLPEDVSFEGEGDALWLAETLVGGYGFRSDREAYKHIARILDCQVLPVKLTDERFYHLDTCFCPIDMANVLYYPEAFDKRSIHELHRTFECHAVDEADAVRFACNSVVLGDDVIMPSGATGARDIVHKLGKNVHFVDMDEFMKAGGAAKCLSIHLWDNNS